MKKILIASTALVLTAGFAAADAPTLSGSARMGIVYNGTDAVFTSRVRMVGTAAGTTDGGLSFGASMRFDQVGGNGATTITSAGPDNLLGTADDVVTTVGNTGTSNGDSTVFLSGAFGKITMGDVAGGAADYLVGQVSGVGFTGNGDLNEIGFNGGTATAARYEYSTGPITFALGLGQTTAGNDAMSVATKFAAADDKFTIAVGYSSTTAATQIDAKGTAKLGAATIAVRVASNDNPANANDLAVALSVSGTFAGVGVTAFASQNRDFQNTDAFGVGASYDLGGGASVAGGVSDDGSNTTADLGVSFSF